MKVLIQDPHTERYLGRDGNWSNKPDNARDFHFSSYAYDFARRERVHGFRVVFYFEELDYAIKARKWTGGARRLMGLLDNAI